MIKKTIALAAVAASLAAFAPASDAEAGKLRHGFRHFGHHHHWRPHYVFVGPSCHYYYKKWKWTGSSYWKHKYYDCIY